MTTSELDKCVGQHTPGATTTELAKDLRVITTQRDGIYLFARIADRWRNVTRLDDANYELVAAKPQKVTGQPGVRIELGHFIEMRHVRGWLRERILFVCSDKAGCQRHTTACTVMQDGKAVEMFHTSTTITEDGSVAVLGDRSKAGTHCQHR
jgi:hypothetical protein